MGKPTCTMHDERYRNAPLVGRGYTLCTCHPIPVAKEPPTQPATPPPGKVGTTERAVLEAFRNVTGWTDAEVLHYAVCGSYCNPICGYEEYACDEGRAARDGQPSVS